MAEVRAELILESSDALSTIDFIGTSLEGVVTNFSESFGQAISGIQGDFGSTADDISTNLTSSLTDAITSTEPEIAALADVPITPTVTADVSEAEGSIAALSGETVDLTVSADTSDAEAAISDLGGSADSASGSMDALTAATGGFKAAAGLAAGETGALGGEVAGLGGPVAAAGVGGVAALGGILQTLFGHAVDAQGSIQRFNAILGPMATAVQQVHIGDLNTTVDDLSKKLGDTTPNVQNAVASIFQWQINSGRSAAASAQFSDEILALSARAVGLNPRLGNLGDVANGLSLRIGNARFAARNFGIALTQNQIDAEALTEKIAAAGNTQYLYNLSVSKSADDQKKAAELTAGYKSQITAQDKAFASATLASDKYKGSINAAVEQGASNPITQQKQLTASFEETLATLGKPLIAPMFDLIKKVLPIAAEFAKEFAGIGKEILPALIPVLQAALPPLQIFGELLRELEPVIRPLTTAVALLAAPIVAISFAVQHWGEVMDEIRPILTTVGTAIAGFFTGIFDSAKSVLNDLIGFFTDLPGNILNALTALPKLLFNVGVDAVSAILQGQVSALGDLLQFFTDLPGKAITALGDVGAQFVQIGVDITNGIIDGVGSLGDALFTALTGGIDFTITKVKGKYQISSPSQVFANQIGLPIATGVALGITSGGSAIQSALVSVVSPTAPLSQAVTAQASGSYPGGLGVSGAGSGPSVQQNFYGYSPQETAAVTGREWTRLTRFSGGG